MQPQKEPYDSEILDQENTSFLDYLENANSENLSDMVRSRVIPSIIHSMRRQGTALFSESVLKMWVIDMLMDGLKGSTIKRYVGALHTLFDIWQKENLNVSNLIDFSIPKNIYESDNRRILEKIEENLVAAQRMVNLSIKQNSPAYVYNKAFQYLLFDPFATLQYIVNLKFTDPKPECIHIEDIVTSMRNAPQAKYVFPLQQGKRREPAIIKDLLVELHATARRAGLKFEGSFSRESITSLWIAAAIKEGIAYQDIRGMIQTLPNAYSFLSLIEPSEVSESRKREILNIVAYSITNKNPGWFVLRMRSGVTPERIKERLKEKESPLQRQIQYYYPQRTIKRIEKKKVITEEAPVIPGLLFIRLPFDQVSPLIGIIGDLAWCYRTTANPSSPYSVIPQAEMKIFQRCVGAFTEDIEMDIISELPPLNVGDEVVIENGTHLDGQIATIRAVRSVDGTLTYTLQLSDTEFIKWKDVSLPASHISKVNS